MIRRGRAEGWLALPASALPSWALLNGAALQGVQIADVTGRGCGVVAAQELPGDNKSGVLMTVPRDLVLSLESVKNYARADQNLSEILEGLSGFGNPTRAGVLVFLLCQASLSCPDVATGGFIRTPFTEYLKFLPLNALPTSWALTARAPALLSGTTLGPAVSAKLSSLQREFDLFKEASSKVQWCSKNWWRKSPEAPVGASDIDAAMADLLEGRGQDGDSDDTEATPEDEGDRALITFDDWLQVDNFYRSRALEFPGIGDATVPVIDMANHAGGDGTSALYECDTNGDAVLLLRDGKSYAPGDEVTITYGDNKGACEMLFSYGFIEDGMEDARELFLDLEMPDDDPLARAKVHVSNSPPGFKVYRQLNGEVGWEGSFIWLIVVNEEDGLDFQVLQSVDGANELKAFWQDQEVADLEEELRQHLESDSSMWDVFQLRAVATLQARVQGQLEALARSDHLLEGAASDALEQRHELAMIRTLRVLEKNLLQKADAMFEQRKQALLASPIVTQYLGQPPIDNEGGEDFT